jgi:EAL domain-containing protein (putative c-di-GMP-specific phosphodiesterase class I)
MKSSSCSSGRWSVSVGRISTCEALLRWNHPVRGTVRRPITGRRGQGLIVDLGRWICGACMECMK